MSSATFSSRGEMHKITIYGAPPHGKQYPAILLAHGNFGLGPPYGDQIHGFAEALATEGYLTAVPQFYTDDNPHPFDTTAYVDTLADAILAATNQPRADANRLGLIGFSLGAATAMNFIAGGRPVMALADFFGFLTPSIRAGVSAFPPTIIFHNKNDLIVPVENSVELDRLLGAVVKHQFIQYDEYSQIFNHAFEPGGPADVDSRSRATQWFLDHMPPTGI